MKLMAQPETVKSIIARFKDKPLDFKPGEKFHYSNSGYFLLGAIIEKVSGLRYEAFLKEAIFDPLGMKDTGYDHPATVLPHRASGYNRKRNGLENAEYEDATSMILYGQLAEDTAQWHASGDDRTLLYQGVPAGRHPAGHAGLGRGSGPVPGAERYRGRVPAGQRPRHEPRPVAAPDPGRAAGRAGHRRAGRSGARGQEREDHRQPGRARRTSRNAWPSRVSPWMPPIR